MLRRQVEGEEDARARLRRAEVVASQGSISGSSMHDQYEFVLINGGPAVARAASAWPRDAEGRDVIGPVHIISVLLPQERQRFYLQIPPGPSRSGGLTLWGSWDDDTGPRQERLLDINPL